MKIVELNQMYAYLDFLGKTEDKGFIINSQQDISNFLVYLEKGNLSFNTITERQMAQWINNTSLDSNKLGSLNKRENLEDFYKFLNEKCSIDNYPLHKTVPLFDYA